MDGTSDDEVGQSRAGLTPASWTDVVGVSASADDLSKTAPETTFNAGAVSVQALAGDGFVEFTTAEATTDKLAGLSNGNGGQGYKDIDFAIRLNATGRASVYEGGVNRGGIGAYAAGDLFRVQAQDGMVTYYKNGRLVYTSGLSPAFPLLVDTSLRTPGATIRDVAIEPIDVWTEAVGVAVDGRDITKTAPEDLFNAGAVSVNSIASGDGYVEFTAADASSQKAAGLSSGNSNQGRGDIDFAISLNSSGGIAVYELGVLVASNLGTYQAGDVFRVQVKSGIVSYLRNRVPFYTSAAAPAYPLLLDASIKTPGASILSARLVAGYATDDCAPVEDSLPGSVTSMDADGDIMIAAEPTADPAVAAVYRQGVAGWVLDQDLLEPAGPPDPSWAGDVATDSQTIAVRGGGSSLSQPRYWQLYAFDGADWIAGQRIDSCPDGDNSGLVNLAVRGDLLAVREQSPLRVRVYRRVSGTWILDGLLPAPAGSELRYVAAGGDRVFVGTTSPGGSSILVYRYNAGLPDPTPPDPCGPATTGKWRLRTTLAAPGGHVFGRIAAGPSGTRLLIGDTSSGDAHVIDLVAGSWTETALLRRTPFGSNFGNDVDLGGPGGDSVAVVGTSRTWVYAELDDGWTEIASAASDRDIAVSDAAVFSGTSPDGITVRGLDEVCLAE